MVSKYIVIGIVGCFLAALELVFGIVATALFSSRVIALSTGAVAWVILVVSVPVLSKFINELSATPEKELTRKGYALRAICWILYALAVCFGLVLIILAVIRVPLTSGLILGATLLGFSCILEVALTSFFMR